MDLLCCDVGRRSLPYFRVATSSFFVLSSYVLSRSPDNHSCLSVVFFVRFFPLVSSLVYFLFLFFNLYEYLSWLLLLSSLFLIFNLLFSVFIYFYFILFCVRFSVLQCAVCDHGTRISLCTR